MTEHIDPRPGWTRQRTYELHQSGLSYDDAHQQAEAEADENTHGSASRGAVRADLVQAAKGLQAEAVFRSVVDGNPGLVSDALAEHAAPELLAEMCNVGMWRRVDGGYQITDERAVVGMTQLIASFECDAAGGHVATPGRAECTQCGNIIDANAPRL